MCLAGLQVEAENRAAASAKEGLSRKLKDAETRVEMVSEQLSDLQSSLERQRAAADSRYCYPLPLVPRPPLPPLIPSVVARGRSFCKGHPESAGTNNVQ
jgi:hypothetical protein